MIGFISLVKNDILKPFHLSTGCGTMLRSSEKSSMTILFFLPEQTPSVVLETKQTVHKFASVAVTVEVEVVRGKKTLGFLTLRREK